MQPGLPFDESPVPDPESRSSESPPPNPEPQFVRHVRAKRYVVRVREDGSVRVTIPRWGSKREAQAFAASQGEWIERQRRRIEEERTRPREVMAPEVERELRMRARRELPSRLLALAAEHGLSVGRVSVRNQRWRWGSCSRNGHICLNWRLATMPDWVRDYVMIHELMHLEQMNHSPRFWKLVAAGCPEYQAARQYLREHRRG